jgi:hypothetical protein
VDHLVADRDGLRVLCDAQAVAVDDGQQRAKDAARDATVVQREVFEVVERPSAKRAARACARCRLRRRRQGRHLAVRRIDDQRRVAEGANTELVTQERADVDGEVTTRLVALRALGELLGCQLRAIGLIARPIHRHAAKVVGAPSALEARVPPRRARRLPVLVDVGCGRRLGGHAAQRRNQRGIVVLCGRGCGQSADGERENRPVCEARGHGALLFPQAFPDYNRPMIARANGTSPAARPCA